ncbi:MAG: tRNA (N6-threonylcarbamoyladenosine(37)-N6)-methyltransferase TrmO [Candidatus Aenigmatarchaeota archaeon]
MNSNEDARRYQIGEIGTVKNDFSDEIPEDYKRRTSVIEVFEEYAPSLQGIEENSHIIIFFWLHRSDRDVQRVHPMGDKSNPLTGVFATRAPVRANPIGETICRLEKREGNKLYVVGLDALDNTPVIDIKPFTDAYRVEETSYPDWAPRRDEG